ncbi:M50 family metallopeptidase [Georgenia sp. Z1344]|uniref:M50 family metallopeptidase n=1 Tax=Georgenia sp. Z1344 TaxID=3416706 RepID=UPI003CEA1941
MDVDQIWPAVWERTRPTDTPEVGTWALVALGAALAVVLVPVLWRLVRPAVTIAHELGHAGVGILVGRRFTGFVVSSDMSGHAVTVGPRRGFGRVATTWAGYPAPALLGAALVNVGLRGWAGIALLAALLVLLVSLAFSRSLHTVAAVLGAAAVVGGVWWFGGPDGAAILTLAAGVFLLLGAWRHIAVVATTGRRGDDPAQLADLTRVPSWLWTGTFVLVAALCTWWAWTALSPVLPADLLSSF